MNQIKTEIYDNIKLEISDFKKELESQEYYACRFKLNGKNIISRNGKITSKKIGQFVTFWNRNKNGVTQPFNETERIDFYTVNVRAENQFGQFVFPKSELIKKGIISTQKKEGKRGFRVYPSWDKAKNKQAEKTQKWQLEYFYHIDDSTNLNKVAELYKNK
ncbi:MepB family protein [Winogradskyella sp. SM1960]|uniref:MepB family protein n=1 Tax=Winogradskyella sp. SM1960 TaxID=2865955 RepID=UPI00293D7701|nr:MepB family protein [Winogradskyella sp. SM1960]